MADVTYPSNSELQEIAQELMPRLEAGRATFEFFPIVTQDTYLLMWEQMDNFLGLQYARGLNGQPTRIKKTGARRFQMQPGVYGEFEYIDEEELTVRRQYGTYNTAINLDDVVSVAQAKLMQRQYDRIETIVWNLLVNGTFSVASPNGAIVHTDIFTRTAYTASPLWTNAATAVPLADFRAVKLLAHGKSVNFGYGAEAWMNQTTFNMLMTNTNPNDLGGRRLSGLQPVNNPAALDQILLGDGLPHIRIYDNGYLDETSTYQPLIPNNRVILLGQRPAGQTVGQYRMVRNANNPGFAPGAYTTVVDNIDDGPPRSIAVHQGHNGGPVLFFGTAIVCMTV